MQKGYKTPCVALRDNCFWTFRSHTLMINTVHLCTQLVCAIFHDNKIEQKLTFTSRCYEIRFNWKWIVYIRKRNSGTTRGDIYRRKKSHLAVIIFMGICFVYSSVGRVKTIWRWHNWHIMVIGCLSLFICVR